MKERKISPPKSRMKLKQWILTQSAAHLNFTFFSLTWIHIRLSWTVRFVKSSIAAGVFIVVVVFEFNTFLLKYRLSSLEFVNDKMSLVCRCYWHAFRFPKLRRQKVIFFILIIIFLSFPFLDFDLIECQTPKRMKWCSQFAVSFITLNQY